MILISQQNIQKLNYKYKIYNFMRWYKIAFSLSTVLFISSLTIILIKGFVWGLDFTGGTIIRIYFEKLININQLYNALKHDISFTNFVIQKFGSNHEVIIRTLQFNNILIRELQEKILNTIHLAIDQNAYVKCIQFVGPSVGRGLIQDSSLALFIALFCILIYITFRFEWRLATGAVLALLHDIIITLGILSSLCIEIDLTIIASLMSVIGYSLNDSIVVFDRIRKNFRKINFESSYNILNISLTETLKRTIITSVTTLILIVVLMIFGGPVLRGFSITLFIGILIGTVSSIYVASILALKLGIKREHFLDHKIEKEDGNSISSLS